MKSFLISLIGFAATEVSAATGNCYALALSGGGSKGSYEAGALLAFTSKLAGSEIEWDIVSGISAGSMNTVGMSVFPKGQEVEAAAAIKDLWYGLTDDSIYKDWPKSYY
jgi:NTE family protein